jgi:hypothetical protein
LTIQLALLAAACVFGPFYHASAMDFQTAGRVAGCGEVCVVGQGAINDQTTKQFRQYVAREKLHGAVAVSLDSQGGTHTQGIAMGEAIRKLGFSTVVGRLDPIGHKLGPGICASACVYAFIGGVERRVTAGSKVGVHQVRLNYEPRAQTASEAQLLMALAANHLSQCGATIDVLTLALATPPEEMRWMSAVEMSQYGVITERVSAPASGGLFAEADRGQTIRYRLLSLPVPERPESRGSS